jgi:hypothetical protein
MTDGTENEPKPDLEPKAVPALPEPFGYCCEHTLAEPYFVRPPSYIPPTGGNYVTTPLYTASALQEALDRADRAETGRDSLAARLATAYEVKAECNDDANRERRRATTAEAALEGAREVIKPFAEASISMDAMAVHFGAELRGDDYKPKTGFTHGQLRAARQWLSANPEVKG